MTALDLDRLLTVARAARDQKLPPWYSESRLREDDHPLSNDADIRHIVTFDPPTCEALLLRLQDAEQADRIGKCPSCRRVETLEQERDDARAAHAELIQAAGEKYEALRDRAKTAATELGGKNDRLAAALAALRESVTALADEWEAADWQMLNAQMEAMWPSDSLRALTGAPEETDE